MYRLPSPCGLSFYGHTGGTRGYITFAAGLRDASRIYVFAWNGVGQEAIRAMDAYIDDLLCRD